MTRVLLVSSTPALIDRLQSIGGERDQVTLLSCATLADARAQALTQKLQLILIHVTGNKPAASVAAFVAELARSARTCPCVVLADAYDDLQAISFFRAGVADYLGIPQDLAKLAFLIDVFGVHLQRQPLAAAKANGQRDPFYYIVAADDTKVMDQLQRVAAQFAPVLLTGETGTGKTRLARLIHSLSPHRDEPFLMIHCGAAAAHRIDCELFGQAQGAFTGADRDQDGKLVLSGQGTLFLDEINALPLPLQIKLARALEERSSVPVGGDRPRPIRARLIAASRVPLDQEVLAGRFRADLYYCLNVVGFFLPALREQRHAVAALCQQFLAACAHNGSTPTIAPTALDALMAYSWPGNIRQLRAVIGRAVELTRGKPISLHDLPERIVLSGRVTPALRLPATNGTHVTAGTLTRAREEVEIQEIRKALRKHQNNRLRAALELGISRMGLYKKLHKYGLLEEA